MAGDVDARHAGGEGDGQRTVLLVLHVGREAALNAAREVVGALSEAGIAVREQVDDDGQWSGIEGAEQVGQDADAVKGIELVVVIGGDGTVLRGAEAAREADVPLLGVNLGRVGFLAEAEYEELSSVVKRIVAGSLLEEERMTIDVTVSCGDSVLWRTWALNEVSVEKVARERMLELRVDIDDRQLSAWGCDGVVCATPTGSTAYAFSAGGPVVWPTVEALLLVPISAHALFARPLVTSPKSVLALEVRPSQNFEDMVAALWCDGRRSIEVPAGTRIEVRRGVRPVRFARLHDSPFTGRLVAKFDLPTDGWRGER